MMGMKVITVKSNKDERGKQRRPGLPWQLHVLQGKQSEKQKVLVPVLKHLLALLPIQLRLEPRKICRKSF